MVKRCLTLALAILGVLWGATVWPAPPQDDANSTVIRKTVNLVVLDVAVTDKKGDYVSGLGPNNFAVYEDGIHQKLASFGGEGERPRELADFQPQGSRPKLVKPTQVKRHAKRDDAPGFHDVTQGEASSLIAGASVFILFDTSNYMYRGFVFAQDAIAEFVRSLRGPDRVAFYSYSRDFSRAAPLTANRSAVLRGVRDTVAGDEAALYNALLMTLKDAAHFSGRRAVVVFSNGPDDASVISPEDVRELAQAEGIPIYMISTRAAKLDPLSTAVFERMSASTGGEAFFAKNWEEQQKAFAAIRDDLAHLYLLSYYPQTNPNRGWRSITVKLVGKGLKKYHVRTRSGYRPELTRMTDAIDPTP
jgi:Ca-activated chloride channel homolog